MWINSQVENLPPLRAMTPVGIDGQTLSFDQKLRACADRCLVRWNSPGPVPSWGEEISLHEKMFRESKLEQHIGRFKKLVEFRASQPPATWREDLLRTAKSAARTCVGLPNSALELVFNSQALETTRQFIAQARAFDPEISEANIMQAMRNVWVAHSLQAFAGLPLSLSPALFAYSMLYPWTDNRLDDAQLSRAEKRAFCDWLDVRLQGLQAAPIDRHAEQVSRLVGLIETCFPRAAFPEVYLSLLAIHRAQIRSVSQQRLPTAPDEEAILDITLAKGGTSVLVDACLLHGRLDKRTSTFAFEYGVCLQLLDDLQDLKADLQNQHATLFTAQTYVAPLDSLTARLWSFFLRVLQPCDVSDPPGTRELKPLIHANCRLLLLQAVAKHQEFFTREFVQNLEAVSPLRFSYLAQREKALANEYASLIPRLRRQANSSAVAALLDQTNARSGLRRPCRSILSRAP